jgi:alpha-L-rhamnosidase
METRGKTGIGGHIMSSPIVPARLLCEYRTDPLGIDRPKPRLSWTFANANSNARGRKQTAYQILAASSREILDRNSGDLWDSGKFESPLSIHIPSGGKPLASAQQIWWKVRVWNGASASDWSEPATFTMGLLEPADWFAIWITADPRTYASQSLPIFRREIAIDQTPTRAIAFICGLGQFELRINGQKVGENVLDPGWTDYSKTCLYVAHDVTPYLRQGPNALGVLLGNGMYHVTGPRYKKFNHSFGPPKFILQIYLTFPDGSQGVLISDESWTVSPGPIRFTSIYGGEDYDARDEQPGWDSVGFDAARWKNVAITAGPGGMLRSQSAPPVRVMQAFDSIHQSKIAPDIALYDFGRNFSGWPQIHTTGQSAPVTLVPGELLDETGRVSQHSSGGPVSFTYTGNGQDQTWNPRFGYTGFRYLEARGNPDTIEKITGQFVHSCASVVGKFRCSNPLFNQIHELINAAILCNLQSVLTDCPHREKLGWLEQSYLMGTAVMFNYDVPLLYTKICGDMRDAQWSDGCMPTIAPEYTRFKPPNQDFSNSPEWGSAAIVNPWLVYQQYGDEQILYDNFDMMRRYVQYLHRRSHEGIIDFGLGDWYDIGPGEPGLSKLTSKALTGTAIYYLDLQILQKVCQLLGNSEEAELCSVLAKQVRGAFSDRFFHADGGYFDRNSQTANAMPLAIGLVDPADAPRVVDHLVADIRARQNHVSAGDIGFRFVLQALSQAGRSDVIFDMLSRSDPPSYGAQLRAGATTLTEAWDANPKHSQNHLMLGHAELWFYETLAGIQLDLSSRGEDRLVIRPAIVGDISWAEASYDSIVGHIACRWERSDNAFTMSVEIPFNTTANVYLPASADAELTEGGRPIANAADVRLKSQDSQVAILDVGAGRYFFQSR